MNRIANSQREEMMKTVGQKQSLMKKTKRVMKRMMNMTANKKVHKTTKRRMSMGMTVILILVQTVII